MRALVFDGSELRYEDQRPAPKLPPSHVLVRVRKAGICNTDLELIKGYMGFAGVLGHEFVGTADTGRWAGRRVVGEINLACQACAMCRSGAPNHCPHRTTLGIDRHDGAFADFLTLPEANLHAVPDEVSDDEAVFVEPVAAALQTLRITHVGPHQRVVLLGAGKLGLLVAQVLARTGCDLTVVTRYGRQRELLSAWNITAAGPDDVPGRSADIVVDCTGTQEGFAAALALVRPRGVVHLKSTYEGLPQVDLTRV